VHDPAQLVLFLDMFLKQYVLNKNSAKNRELFFVKEAADTTHSGSDSSPWGHIFYIDADTETKPIEDRIYQAYRKN